MGKSLENYKLLYKFNVALLTFFKLKIFLSTLANHILSLLLCTYKSKTECANVLKYLKTRFVRALIAMATSTQQMSKANFRFVPLQDFTKPWTDDELYKKYNLTDDEIKFIESMIKPM